MIESLSISNYALIDNIDLSFGSGLNIITGETGAGKSIMLGALSMLLGNRADSRVVTDKDKKSVVEASFNISRYPHLKKLIDEAEVDWDDNTLILRREITPTGRSRSFINDSPVTLAKLREIAIHLVDLHSQHQNLLLADTQYQLQILDTLLPDKSIKTHYQQLYSDFAEALKKYRRQKKQIEASRADEEYMRFQLEKLDELDPHEGEQIELENERDTLANMGDVKSAFSSLNSIFGGEDSNIVDNLKYAAQLLEGLDTIPEAAELAERVNSLQIEAQDIADSIEALDSRLEADPNRLEEVEERLSDIYTLQRKHNVNSIEELIDIRSRLASDLENIDNSDELLKSLAAAAKRAKIRAVEAAAELTKARRAVADQFAEMWYASATPLGMKNLRIVIEISPAELSSEGADDVSFLVAFNKNQQPMPIRDTASGGEISRLMLVVKAIIANRMRLPAIIFDEIDTGVSGDIASRMGDLMKEIAEHIQVIAITHLPQVAARGDSHHKVYKQDNDTSTNTHIITLDDDQRLDELALMLSGDSSNAAARETAKSLIENGRK